MKSTMLPESAQDEYVVRQRHRLFFQNRTEPQPESHVVCFSRKNSTLWQSTRGLISGYCCSVYCRQR